MFITGCPSNLDPPIIIILPLNILCPHAPSFTLRILCFCIPAHFCRKQVAWLEGHLELVADGFEPVSFVFFVPHEFVWVDVIGLLAFEFFAMGACVLCWCLIVVLLCFLLLFAVCLGSFVLLAVASTWFAFLFR